MGHDHLFWLSNLNWTKKQRSTTGHSPIVDVPPRNHLIVPNIFAYDAHFVAPNSKPHFFFVKYPPQTFSWLIMAKLDMSKKSSSHQKQPAINPSLGQQWSPPAREWSMTVHGATAVAKCCKSGYHLKELFDLDSDSS